MGTKKIKSSQNLEWAFQLYFCTFELWNKLQLSCFVPSPWLNIGFVGTWFLIAKVRLIVQLQVSNLNLKKYFKACLIKYYEESSMVYFRL